MAAAPSLSILSRKLDLEHDPVLVSAVGIVAPGSVEVGHSSSEMAPAWWVSYTAKEKQINQEIPTKEQIAGLMVCPECGSLNPRNWHHIQYTAIRYPVMSVNPLQIVTIYTHIGVDLKRPQMTLDIAFVHPDRNVGSWKS